MARRTEDVPDIEITPEMVEAGGRILSAIVGDCPAGTLAEAVFREMIAASHGAARLRDGLGSSSRRGDPKI
jgi:hypothetical protein